MTIQILLYNKSKYMYLLLRKQAVFKMSNIDGVVKTACFGYFLKNTKKQIFRVFSNRFMTHTAKKNQVFNADM